MAFDIAQFNINLGNVGGLLRNNKYIVNINPPPILTSNVPTMSSVINNLGQIEFLCDSTSLPAAALITNDIRRYGYGPIEKKPLNILFTDIDMSFMMDGQIGIYNIIYQWINIISNFKWTTNEDGGGGITTATGFLNSNNSPYELAYKNEYATTMQIGVYDARGRSTPNIAINLRDAYPTFLGDIPLNWASTDPYIRVPVTFTFFDWYITLIS